MPSAGSPHPQSAQLRDSALTSADANSSPSSVASDFYSSDPDTMKAKFRLAKLERGQDAQAEQQATILTLLIQLQTSVRGLETKPDNPPCQGMPLRSPPIPSDPFPSHPRPSDRVFDSADSLSVRQPFGPYIPLYIRVP